MKKSPFSFFKIAFVLFFAGDYIYTSSWLGFDFGYGIRFFIEHGGDLPGQFALFRGRGYVGGATGDIHGLSEIKFQAVCSDFAGDNPWGIFGVS